MTWEQSLWESARILWMKYCGVADEYRMLRDRWSYAASDSSFTSLPYLKGRNKRKTFDMLDNHIKVIDNMFYNFYDFQRKETERFEKKKFKKCSENSLKEIENYFYELTNYVGLLKLGFYQRTVSSEIPHVISGLPHSPERTIGDELFYLAAEEVAKRYEICLNIPYGKWDEFITFAPPIKDYFYGAFYKPSPYLELFHISMSEEQKYFVGTYMLLAHEFGHSMLINKKWDDYGNRYKIDYPYWEKKLLKKCSKALTDIEYIQPEKCKYCGWFAVLTDNLIYSLNEILADIIAYKLNGKNYLHSFIDQFRGNLNYLSYGYGNLYFLLDLLRITVLHNYIYRQRKNTSNYLNTKITNMLRINDKIFTERYLYCCREGFIGCIFGISKKWAKIIINYDEKGFYFQTDEEYFKFSSVIDEYEITKGKESHIIDSLYNGEICTNEDPRDILHCYYEAYKGSVDKVRPNYSATIFSLAYNQFAKNEQKKE